MTISIFGKKNELLSIEIRMIGRCVGQRGGVGWVYHTHDVTAHYFLARRGFGYNMNIIFLVEPLFFIIHIPHIYIFLDTLYTSKLHSLTDEVVILQLFFYLWVHLSNLVKKELKTDVKREWSAFN